MRRIACGVAAVLVWAAVSPATGFQPAPAAASSTIAEASFSGRLNAGERFVRRFGPDFEFVIAPGRIVDGRFDSWSMGVFRVGQRQDLAELTLPFMGPRPPDIMAWHFLPTSSAPKKERWLRFSPEVGTTITEETLRDAIGKDGSYRDVNARIDDFGRVDFLITDLKLTGNLTNDDIGFAFMAFDVRITWPAAYRAGQLTNDTPTDVQLIRAARGRSNKAIAAHDLDGIASVWMEDIHVTSSTSAQTTGREANRQRMATQFKNRPDTVYVREPNDFRVYAPWEVAQEFGQWTGTWTEPDGKVRIGGDYFAQWRRIDGRWLIQSELYVPTHCRGSRYCNARP